jgi:hypothetical protein
LEIDLEPTASSMFYETNPIFCGHWQGKGELNEAPVDNTSRRFDMRIWLHNFDGLAHGELELSCFWNCALCERRIALLYLMPLIHGFGLSIRTAARGGEKVGV